MTEPGLHFKIPFVENVIILDKRILDLDMPKQEVLAADNTRIEVDAFLRYRIVDPLKFYQSVGSVAVGEVQLGYILNSAVRRVLGDVRFDGDRERPARTADGQHSRPGQSGDRQTRRLRRRCAHPPGGFAEADFR